jgi:hypothetical protein
MKILVLGFLAIVLALGTHGTLWKIRVPQRQTRTLLILFAASGLIAAIAAQPLSAIQVVYLLTMVGAIGISYAAFYTAVEADSPSLDIMLLLDRSASGVSQQALLDIFNDEVLVLSRLEDLVRCRMVIFQDGRYRIAASGEAFISVFIRFRKLLNAGKGG